MKLKCLVTGAAGFVGSHLCERLLKDGYRVVGIDCFTDNYPRSVKESNLSISLQHNNFSFLEKDLADMDLASLLEGIDVVFHQAALAGVRTSWGEAFSEYIQRNVLVTQRLFEASIDSKTLKKFVFASSSSVYGDSRILPVYEDSPLVPESPYGVTKLAADCLARVYAKNFGVPTVALRYFTVYGPRQRPDMAFTKFLKAIYRNEEISVFGDGLQTRDFTYISDAVEANILAMTQGKPGAFYNVGGGSRVTLKHCIEVLEQATGLNARIKSVEKQRGDVAHTWADTTLAQRELGFVPKVSLEDGLKHQAAWAKQLFL